MDLGLSGRKAIVTGGSKGIGKAIAETLVAEGADVAICARDKVAIDETVASLQATGGNVFGESVDITDAEAFPAFITSAAERLGGLDTLIFNASVQPQGDDDDTWQLTFQSDVMATVRAMRVAQPLLAASDMHGGGSVVAISSITGLQQAVAPGMMAYGTLKAAVLTLNGKMAHVLAADGVRMNTVIPGCITFPGGTWDTMAQRMPPVVDGVAKSTMRGRLGEVDEIASTVVFLASPRSSYTTGASLRVDGGIVKGVDF